MLTPRSASARQGGFTLVEMMVAMVLGLVVVSAVLAFIFSLIRANSETVLSTRLNQELRGTMSLIANDLRRARGVSDPIGAVNQGGAVNNPFSTVAIPVSKDCVRYSYSADGATDYRAMRLNSATNKIELVRQSTAAAATCTATGTAINSDGVEITGLVLDYDPATNGRRIDITLTGRLRNPPAYMGDNPSMAISTKTIRQTIAIRSNGT